MGGKNITGQCSSIYSAWGTLSCTKGHSASLLTVFHCYLLLNQRPFINASFFLFPPACTTLPPPISSYSKGPNRSGVVLLTVGVAEGVSGEKREEKKKHQRCHEGQSHQLRNIHQWVGKCDGTVMTGEQATSPTLAHSPWPHSPSVRKHGGHSEYV